MKNKIIQGEALEELKKLKSESIDCVMTSPPYWALRDYGVEGQLGLEPTFDQFINNLCNIFDEVQRVLKKSGTCWVNLGDTYNAGRSGGHAGGLKGLDKPENSPNQSGVNVKELKAKSLVMIPFRFAIEMVNRGWILRNVIVWHKKNCMPSSVKDRFTVDFEYLFFFSKSKKYWFDRQFEPYKEGTEERYKYNFDKSGRQWSDDKESLFNEIGGIGELNPQGRNKRCVWTINPQPFPEAHFAVYPEKLCETPIKSGCPKDGIVLDPFMGAGTTAVMAKKLGRDFLGIELNPEYIKIAEKRLKKAGLDSEPLTEWMKKP